MGTVLFFCFCENACPHYKQQDRVSLLELQLAAKDQERRPVRTSYVDLDFVDRLVAFKVPDEISSLRAQLERLQKSEQAKDEEISRLEIQVIPGGSRSCLLRFRQFIDPIF